MQAPPKLTDRATLLRNRRRASSAPALFIQEAVADELIERLNEVNRTFTTPLIVTGWPEVWKDRMPNATIIPDDETLGLTIGAHDLVIHMMGLHWANDIVGQLIQCRRALRPDGLLLATLFGGKTMHELRSSLAEAEAAVTGGLSPRIAPMAEIRDLGGVLQRAGLALPVADGTSFNVSYGHAFDLMRDLRAMGEGNALAGRQRKPTKPAILQEAARIYAASFGGSDGRIPALFEVITLTGWAPSDTQQKPLRPGSAVQRLAEALNTQETPLKN